MFMCNVQNGVCNVAKKKIKPARINLGLTVAETEKLNDYIIATAQHQGKVPSKIKTKILRMAFDEWMEKHSKDYDIDWNSRG